MAATRKMTIDKRTTTLMALMKKSKCEQEEKEEEAKMNTHLQKIPEIAMKAKPTRKTKETKAKGIRKDKEVISSLTKKKTMNRGEMRMITSKRATSRLEETRNVVTNLQ